MEPNELHAEAECKHRWVLGQPSQGVIPGRCRLCGREREYPAVLADFDRGYDSEGPMAIEQLLSTGVGGARPYSAAGSGRLLADSES